MNFVPPKPGSMVRLLDHWHVHLVVQPVTFKAIPKSELVLILKVDDFAFKTWDTKGYSITGLHDGQVFQFSIWGQMKDKLWYEELDT